MPGPIMFCSLISFLLRILEIGGDVIHGSSEEKPIDKGFDLRQIRFVLVVPSSESSINNAVKKMKNQIIKLSQVYAKPLLARMIRNVCRVGQEARLSNFNVKSAKVLLAAWRMTTKV